MKTLFCLLLAFLIGPLSDRLSAQGGRERGRVTVTYSGARSFLGVAVAEINAERAKALNLKEERGVEITRVEEDSPAAKVGLKVGDVVLEYNGQRVEGIEQFVRLVRETPAGRPAKMLISRGGQTQTVTAVIESRKMRTLEIGDMHIAIPHIEVTPPAVRFPDMPRPTFSWRSPVLGIDAEALNEQLAEFFGVKEGVLVRFVVKGSAAEKAGIKAGDVITKVGDKSVRTPADVTRAIQALDDKQQFSVTVVRDKREMNVTVAVRDDSRRTPPRGRMIRSERREL